ncbi:hypothetical protein PV08_06436 [Exophiala spinifera]|uniref:Myb-like domain-containing protein n=1 Tax=Exophiala spinifera TaxID=91928 RepID=A0A0D2BCN9_9EURO|nr:uncharacterized protein PV08_06436 [Exophiala spinifera]KIW16385.1 hypothetical protein PV08_06436 [Exophiala spinifera]
MSDNGSQDEVSSAGEPDSTRDGDFATIAHEPGSATDSSSATSFHERKWDRLRRNYVDNYLELFKKTFETPEDSDSASEFPATQLGAVTWESAEKASFFQALRIKGRHDIQSISLFIGSKSEIEVKAYLDSLRDQEAERQLFEARPNNISHAEIPAALEIDGECEAMLDQAAEALEAFQEHFDSAVAQRETQTWLIDAPKASELDVKEDEKDSISNAEPGSEAGDLQGPEKVLSFFHLSTFLSLSERFFMNSSQDATTWHQLVEEGQRPAMTLDTVTDLYNLVTSFTQRVVQTCIFIACSRIRASTSAHYKPSRLIRTEDVSTALTVLGAATSLRDFWIRLPRRNQLSIIGGGHRKGASVRDVMSYNEVEAVLSASKRGRSMSTTSEGSHQSRAVSPLTSTSSSVEDEHEECEASDDSSLTALSENDSDGASLNSSILGSIVDRSGESSSADEDEYLERLDQQAGQEEASRLVTFLGHVGKLATKEEDLAVGSKPPRESRKPVEDCMGWSAIYQSEWERDGSIIPAQYFCETTDRAKRRKIA